MVWFKAFNENLVVLLEKHKNFTWAIWQWISAWAPFCFCKPQDTLCFLFAWKPYQQHAPEPLADTLGRCGLKWAWAGDTWCVN